MRGKRSKFGGGTAWEAEVGGKVVLRYAKGRWKDHSGKTIAAERRGDARQTPAGDQSFLPEITIFNGSIAGLSEATTRHLLVAAWIARLWQSRHKYIPLLRALVRGRGESTPFTSRSCFRNVGLIITQHLSIEVSIPLKTLKKQAMNECHEEVYCDEQRY